MKAVTIAQQEKKYGYDDVCEKKYSIRRDNSGICTCTVLLGTYDK